MSRALAAGGAFAIVVGAVGATMVAIAAPAGAAGICGGVLTPDASFSWSEGDRAIALDFDLGANSIDSVEATRALVAGLTVGFPDRAIDSFNSYLDGLVGWYEHLNAACAESQIYEGPYTNRPPGPTSPYGFGGIEVQVGPPVVVIVTDGSDETVEVARVIDQDIGPGRALAQSGGESAVLIYFGTGLVAFGAAALGTRRHLGTNSGHQI